MDKGTSEGVDYFLNGGAEKAFARCGKYNEINISPTTTISPNEEGNGRVRSAVNTFYTFLRRRG